MKDLYKKHYDLCFAALDKHDQALMTRAASKNYDTPDRVVSEFVKKVIRLAEEEADKIEEKKLTGKKN